MATSTVETRTPIVMPAVQTRLDADAEAALLRVVREGASYSIGATGGPEGEAFEKAFVSLIGCADAVSVNSCSSALELAAILSGIGPDDEVIIPAHTFVATAVPFGRTGARIRWADIDPDTRVASPRSIAGLITPRTKVIVAVHLYGLPVEMDPLMTLAAEHGILVVEDCAQAPGARYKGRCVGSIGDFGCFSFHTHKNISTLGEGGMLTVRNADHATLARRMRWMGNWPFTEDREKDWVPAGNNLVVPTPGRWPGNFCMPEALAAVGTVLVGKLDAINRRRRAQAGRFIGALADYPELSFQHVPDYSEHAYHLMSARYDGDACGKHRDDLMVRLRDHYQVKCIVQYWPLYRAELFRTFGFGNADLPETDRFFDNMISFPWWSDMPDDLIDDMAERTAAALADLRG